MKTILTTTVTFLLAITPAWAEESSAEENAEATAASEDAAPVGETAAAPLVLAADDENTYLMFQFGADLFGGPPQGGAEFIGGINASLMVKVMDLLYVGIRPALHYMYVEDSPYEVTWFHADVGFQVNFLHDPLRLYLVGAGGYSAALDGDLYSGLASGWSLFGGVGVAWKFKGPLGIFMELGFRGGDASRKDMTLDRDEDGNPQCTSRTECLSYKMKEVTRDFDLTIFTINIGVTYAP